MIKQEQSFYTWFMAVMGGEVGLCWAVVASYSYLRREEALIVLTAFSLGCTLNTILKTFWSEPRPFTLSDKIIPARCSNFEYGLPSGHTMGFVTVMRTLVLLIEKSQRNCFPFLHVLCLIIAFFVSINRAV